MRSATRIGPGKIGSLFNGWWVVALALIVGVGGPVVMMFRTSRAADERARKYSPNGLFDMSSVQEAQTDAGSLRDVRIARADGLSKRMQMTIALCTSASLRLRAAQVQKGLPVDTGSLYAGLIKEMVNGKPLMPAGFSGPQPGSNNQGIILSSVDGIYLLRYSPEKGMVEVVSVARAAGSGEPAMLARLPDDKDIFGDQIGFYTRYELDVTKPDSKGGLEGVLVPAFADSAMMVGAGWRVLKLSVAPAGAQVKK